MVELYNRAEGAPRYGACKCYPYPVNFDVRQICVRVTCYHHKTKNTLFGAVSDISNSPVILPARTHNLILGSPDV